MRRNVILVACVTAALVLGGCGSDSKDHDKSDKKSSSAGPPAKTADPPTVFNAAAGVPLPKNALRANLGGEVVSRFTTLHRRTAHIVSPTGLSAIDVLTGKQQWAAAVEGSPADPNAQSGPFVNNVGPRPPVVSGSTVVAAVSTAEPGSGTTPGHQAIAVMAVDTKSGKTKWTTKVTVPASVSGYDGNGFSAQVVAVTDKAIVVTYTNEKAMTAAIDANDQHILWTREDYKAGSVNGDIVVGSDANVAENSSMVQTTAVGLTGGDQKWTGTTRSSAVTIYPASSALVVVDSTEYGNGHPWLSFLDPATGAERGKVAGETGFGPRSFGTCDYDQQSVLLCRASDQLIAYDATTGKELWKLPDPSGNRIAPSVTAAWHGAVYGRTQNGPVVLDAKTGKDRSTESGIVPNWVSEYAGIALDQQGSPVAYPVLR